MDVKRFQLALSLIAGAILLGYAIFALMLAFTPATSTPLDPILQAVQRRGELRIAVDPGYAPFAESRADGRLSGYDIELGEALAARLGVAVRFVPTGYDALYDALISDQADLVIAALPYSPERGGQARFSQFYLDAGLMLIGRREQAIAGSGDLRGRAVGAILGSDADARLRQLAASTGPITIQPYDEVGQLIADLQAGRLAAAIVDNISALRALSDPALERIEPLSFEPYVIAMPVRGFQLQGEINRILGELMREGFFAQLEARWLR